MDLMNKFMKTGCVKNRKHNPARVVKDGAVAVAVLDHVAFMGNTHSFTEIVKACSAFFIRKNKTRINVQIQVVRK